MERFGVLLGGDPLAEGELRHGVRIVGAGERVRTGGGVDLSVRVDALREPQAVGDDHTAAGAGDARPVAQCGHRVSQGPQQVAGDNRIHACGRQLGADGVAEGKRCGVKPQFGLSAGFGASLVNHALRRVHAADRVAVGGQDVGDEAGAAASVNDGGSLHVEGVAERGCPQILLKRRARRRSLGIVVRRRARRPVRVEGGLNRVHTHIL